MTLRTTINGAVAGNSGPFRLRCGRWRPNGGSTEPTTLLSSVTYNSVTYSFYSDATCTTPVQMQCGTTAEGYPFVLPHASLTRYFKTDVPSVQIAGASFTGKFYPSTGVTQSGTYNQSYWANGLMENPYFFDGNYSGVGTAQGFDELLAYSAVSSYDASMMPFDATLNKDFGYTGVGTPIAPGDSKSWVKSVRYSGRTIPDGWRHFDRWSVLNVFASAPALGAYAPGLSGTSKTVYATKSLRNLAALGSGFSLPTGKPTKTTVTSTGTSGDYFRTVQPFFGQNGERFRRYFVTDNSTVTSNYSRDFGQLWNDYLTVILSAGQSSYDETMLGNALALGAQMVSLYDRGGFVNRNGAGQNCGHKQYVQLLGHIFANVSGLMAKCIAIEGNVTHQQYWATNSFLALATNYPDSNHSIYMMPHDASDTNKPFFFLGNEAMPTTPTGSNIGTFDALTDTDYELTSGIAGFGEFNNIAALKSGPNGWDGLQTIAQGTDYTSANWRAACIGYWDRYRQYTSIYNTVPYTSRETAYYDATRASSAVPKWTGVPDRVQPLGSISTSVLNPGNGQFTWDWTSLGHNTETLTGYDAQYSFDGISWKAVATNGATGTETGLAPGVKHYVRLRRQSASGWGPYNVNFPWKSSGTATETQERMTITLTGTTATAAANVLAPAIFMKTYTSGQPDYTALANGTGRQTGDVLYAGVGYWTGNVGTFTYQWKRAGSNITGATSQSYTLQSADAGQVITCTVTTSGVSATTASITIPGVSYPSFTTVTFDGATYLSRNALFVGSPADSQQLTFAVIVQMGTGTDSVQKVLYRLGDAAGTASTDSIIDINRTSANKIQVILRSTANATLYTATSTGTLTVADGQVRIMVSVDLNAGTAACWKAPVSTDTGATNLTLAAPTAGTAAYGLSVGQRPFIGAALSGTTNQFAGTLQYVYYNPSYIDLSVSTNRDKFLTANIGNTGAGVSGSQALVMVYGAASNWNAGSNYGSGGNFTTTGAVT